jgi:hypothetical protein
MTTLDQHKIYCDESRQLYLDSRHPDQGALDWKEALREARFLVIGALRASNMLTNVSAALVANGGHMLVFRHLLAPPISQDQFKLICREWTKGTEKDCKPLKASAAAVVAQSFEEWRSRRLTPWINARRSPTWAELNSTIHAVAHLIAQQRVATARRNRIAKEQETSVVQLLEDRNWTKLPSKLIDQRAEVPALHFMHKTRFASGANENQEVDIACGLGGTIVLAIECKVTNDDTNSIKRINDVLKKASAWKSHWGSFVRPAAVMQGVMKFSDVKRLLDSDVEVFWAHRLDIFGSWIDVASST